MCLPLPHTHTPAWGRRISPLGTVLGAWQKRPHVPGAQVPSLFGA